MPKEKKKIVTISDQRTWTGKIPNVALGAWWQINENAKKKLPPNTEFARSYGLEFNQKQTDKIRAEKIRKRVLEKTSQVLNSYHKIQLSTRAWDIIIGHWLDRFVKLIYNRAFTIQQSLRDFNIVETICLKRKNYSLITKDSNEFIWAAGDERWDHGIYTEIILMLSKTKVKFINKHNSPNKFTRNKSNEKKTTSCLFFLKWVLKKILHKLDWLIGFIGTKSNYYIVNSYLPKSKEIFLNLLLFQLPRFLKYDTADISENKKMRNILQRKILYKTKDSIESLIQKLLFKVIPISFVEAFSINQRIASKLNMPKKPRCVFTSNNFDSDDVFKIWLAKQVDQGTTYFAGQHGANYGTHSFFCNPSIEELTANYFLTWGWADNLPKQKPAFLLKTAGEPSLTASCFGHLLFVQTTGPHGSGHSTYDEIPEFLQLRKLQFEFIKKLDKKIVKKVLVRLPAYHSDLPWSDYEKWKKIVPENQIDSGTSRIEKLIKKSKLIVFGYDSTGILENLARNIPLLGLWANGLSHVRASAKPFYQKLVDVGIFHFSAISAANQVSKVWDNIPDWWRDPKLQAARKAFCERYANQSRQPLRQLRKILTTHS